MSLISQARSNSACVVCRSCGSESKKDSVSFHPLCPNHLSASTYHIDAVNFLSSAALYILLPASAFHPTLCAIDLHCGTLLLLSAVNMGSSASQVSLLCLQTHLCCYWKHSYTRQTHTHTHRCSSLALSCKTVYFYWFLWRLLLGRRLSLIKNHLNLTLRLKVTALSFTSLLTPDISMSKYIRINTLPCL